jgi:hypothetical protein
MNALQFLSGKKTYLTSIAAIIVCFGKWQSWWTVPDEVYFALMALGLTFLRSGVARQTPAATPPAESQPGETIPIRRTLILLSALSLSLFCSGCVSPSKLAAVVEQLKDDPAIISTKVSTIYGTAYLTRIGGQTNSVTVSPDGTITVNK